MRYLRSNRRSIRLHNYDYRTPGAYFVTVCAYGRQLLFEDPVLCNVITTTWHSLPDRLPNVVLDEFVVMPNHLHAIVWIHGDQGHSVISLPDIVRTFKSLVAMTYLRWIREHDPARSAAIWQRNYYDRIIRDEHELDNIRAYIRNNPQRWAEDRDNLDALIQRMHASDQ